MDEASTHQIDRLTASALFPFEGDFQLKELTTPMAAELPREGEGDQPCRGCGPAKFTVWAIERWRITTIAPSANPVGLFLETVEHLDFEDFDDQMAAEYGVISLHLARAINGLPSVGRVHVHRWGDGSAHFHVWFQGRPARQLEFYGWGNVLWPQVLPALPKATIEANHTLVLKRFTSTLADSSFLDH